MDPRADSRPARQQAWRAPHGAMQPAGAEPARHPQHDR